MHRAFYIYAGMDDLVMVVVKIIVILSCISTFSPVSCFKM
jgi:hypothetical protein